jgi:hypothetical protein
MDAAEYWQEAVETALDEMGLYSLVESMTAEQRAELGKALASSHQNYGMAFYSPPPSDRISAIERDYKARIKELEQDAERYRETAERTVGRILRQRPDALITITDDGEVLRSNGRIERIA